MHELDAEVQRVQDLPQRTRWPERLASIFKGVPFAMVTLSGVSAPFWAMDHVPPLVEVITSIYAYVVAFTGIVVLEVAICREGMRPRRLWFYAVNLLILLPVYAGSSVLVLAGMRFLSYPNNWTIIPVSFAIEFALTVLICWLILTVVRRATAYIVPTNPSAS